MSDRINNFMKDCAWIRAALYFFIAAIPALMVDLQQHKSFSEISDITLAVIIANFVLQGLIAVRAFIDQSISRTQREKKEKKVELLNEKTN
jgi:cbb3-type cytochrome oxidase subunit 1